MRSRAFFSPPLSSLCPCVVNDGYVFIRPNADLNSIVVLIFAFGLAGNV